MSLEPERFLLDTQAFLYIVANDARLGARAKEAFLGGKNVLQLSVASAWEIAIKHSLGKLELPYRIIDTAAGDLGLSAVRKFDCEAWIPTQGRYRELTSTSNCTDFQARRLGIRTRTPEGTRHVATLNGTLCAVPRTIVAVLENHQQADGSIRVPAALQPYLQGRTTLDPVA